MALSANTVLEVRSGGSDTNGGGFVTGASGTDWSVQDSAQYSVTDGVTAGTTTITSATANFGTDVVGNLIYVQGGTGAVVAGWYQIISRTNATTIVVDRSTGLTAGTGVTLKIGGGLASPGQAGAIATVAGNVVYVKYNATPYTATSASTNIAAGCVSGANAVAWVGYDTTRTKDNTDANKPTFKIGAAVSSATLFAGNSIAGLVRNFVLDGNSQTSSTGMNYGGGVAFNVTFQNFTAGAFVPNASAYAYFCQFTANATTGPVGPNVNAMYCEAFANTVTPFQNASGVCVNCIASANTGASTNGFVNGRYYQNCVAYNNGAAGFSITSTQSARVWVNCIAEANTTYGWDVNAVTGFWVLQNCATYNNTSGRSNGTVIDTGPITGSGSFFTNAASNDFSLNNTAGAGALCRATGYPATFPRGLTANRIDVGAAQHADPPLPRSLIMQPPSAY